ncbi:MAG: hypothetical protein QOH12_2013 [Solirubrobacteraceae bacterium]|nr:hypothetical protein [Solirubrobacteraceae bacterium]
MWTKKRSSARLSIGEIRAPKTASTPARNDTSRQRPAPRAPWSARTRRQRGTYSQRAAAIATSTTGSGVQETWGLTRVIVV